MSAPNPHEVERMVQCLMKGVGEFGDFHGADAMSAVLTFSKRFISAMLIHSSKGEREGNAKKIIGGLREMAMMIEFEEMEAKQLKVH